MQHPSSTLHQAIKMTSQFQFSSRLDALLRARFRGAVNTAGARGLVYVVALASVFPGIDLLPVVKAVHVPRIEGVAFLSPPSPGGIAAPLRRIHGEQTQDCWENRGRGKSSTHTSIQDDDDKSGRQSTTIRYSNGDCVLEVRAEGKFTLRADLTDIESLARGGWMRVEERDGRDSRKYEVRSLSSGAIERVYYVNGDRRELDGAARAWLARTLLAVERQSAFAADTRVPQLWKSGGLDGVLGEIARMPSEYGATRYYSALLALDTRFDTPALNTIIRQATNDLAGSDYYLSQMLGKFAAHRSADESALKLFAEAAVRVKSDYYKSQIIAKVLEGKRLAPETIGSLLRAASTIDSDYYLAEVLKGVAREHAVDNATREYYLNALRKIDSDYYRRQVLSVMNTGDKWDERTSALVVSSVSEMKSDYEKSQSLIALAKAGRVTDWAGYFNAATNMDSDHYKRLTLEAALHQRPLTRQTVNGVLSAALSIKSDSYLSELLSTVANSYPIDNAVRPAFERAIDAIESEHYRGKSLVALRRSTAVR